MRVFARMAALNVAVCLTFAVSGTSDAQERPRRDIKVLIERLKANNVEPWNAGKFLIETGTCIAIEPGNCAATKEYYDRIKGLMNFDIANSNLASFLDYLGYGGIAPSDLEIISSFELMPRDAAEFEALAGKVAEPDKFRKNLKLDHFQKSLLLSSRFFAPKIVNYNVKNTEPNQNPHNAGWRKLVRLGPIPDSLADKAGVKHAYVLFNYAQKDAAAPPFPASAADLQANESFNTQVIVVPKAFVKKEQDSAYFFLYQTRSKNYIIGDALNAAFDIIGGVGTQNYYVPQSCAQCHGHDVEDGLDLANTETGVRPFAKVNYLDTDQWYDMLAADGEFPATYQQKKFDVVFDGGIDHQSKDYARAMDVFRLLNAEIAEQVKGALRYDDGNPGKPTPDQYKLAAVEKWNEIHKTNNQPVAIFGRVLGAAGTTWNAGGALDQKLLPMLNQYCFRCHSSIHYNVFDKQGVKRVRSGLSRMIEDIENSVMPQGRLLAGKVADDLIQYINELRAEP